MLRIQLILRAVYLAQEVHKNLCAPTASLQFEITGWGLNTTDTTYEIDFDDGTTIFLYTGRLSNIFFL